MILVKCCWAFLHGFEMSMKKGTASITTICQIAKLLMRFVCLMNRVEAAAKRQRPRRYVHKT